LVRRKSIGSAFLRKTLPALALLSTSLLFSAFVAELVLRRSMGKPVHFRYPQPWYVHDAQIGHWLEPNQRSFTHDKPVVVNSIGIRGEEYSQKPVPGTRRILALGDSQTFGNGLAEVDTWPALLEQRLNRLGRGPWEVVNGGVAGTDTWQHVDILGRLAEAYAFDGVVLAFYVNDVTQRHTPGPAHKIEFTNTLAKRTSYVLKRSAVLALLWRTYKGLAMSEEADQVRKILTGESSTSVERGWEEVERSLSDIARRTSELGVGLLIVVLPHRWQVANNLDAMAYNERIATVASRLGIESIDVLPELREACAQDNDDLFIPWDGHNGSAANAVIARAIAGPALVAFTPATDESGRTDRVPERDTAALSPERSEP